MTNDAEIRHILLADDDEDDCTFFQEALDEIAPDTSLKTVRDGEELIHSLKGSTALPDVVFIDLNMPRKTGIECLAELKSDERFRQLLVVMYSTSFDKDIVEDLYRHGANHYIRKPAEFGTLKRVIVKALDMLAHPGNNRRENNFVIEVN